MTRVLLLLAVGFLAVAAVAQPSAEPPAVARYHEGAQLYIDGDIEAATRAVEAGLAEAPADARLRALRELLRQQQDGGGGGHPPPHDPPPDGGDEGEDRPDDTQPPPDEGDDGTPPPSGNGGDEGDAPPPSAGPADGSPRGAMTRGEAEALLDAVGGDERLLLRNLRRQPSSVARPERDW